jgi:hypothetical protein
LFSQQQIKFQIQTPLGAIHNMPLFPKVLLFGMAIHSPYTRSASTDSWSLQIVMDRAMLQQFFSGFSHICIIHSIILPFNQSSSV